MTTASELARAVERRFAEIQRERMADVPLLNPALQVQAVGFRAWKGGTLGVLITPWFMNLMLWPDADEETPSPGSNVTHDFPSGRYTFIAAEEPGLGHYRLCSLFSPMHAFADQASAVAAAEAALEELLAPPAPRPVSRRQWLRGALGEAR